MRWFPDKPIRSSVTERKSVHDYLRDLAFDFEAGDFKIVEGDIAAVEGLDNFTQKVVKFVLTEKSDLHPYGLSNGILEATDQDAFEQKAIELAHGLTSSELGRTIESVIGMEKVFENDRNYLLIHLTATGCDEPLTIRVPAR